MNGFGQVSGTIHDSPDDVKDGVLVATIAAVAIVFGVIRAVGTIALGAAVVTVVIGVLSLAITISDIADISDNKAGANVGWGLWLSLIASIGLLLVGIAGIIKRK